MLMKSQKSIPSSKDRKLNSHEEIESWALVGANELENRHGLEKPLLGLPVRDSESPRAEKK